MTEPAADSLIPYDEIVQEALRAVVGRVLSTAVDGQLPGAHHFYITFKTQALGVMIPRHLIERFPDEMTIVLQNKFWDLTVEPDLFSVGLTFNQVPATLVVPFAAVTRFQDPAVDFALQFQVQESGEDDDPPEPGENDGPIATPVEDGSNVVSVDFKRKK